MRSTINDIEIDQEFREEFEGACVVMWYTAVNGDSTTLSSHSAYLTAVLVLVLTRTRTGGGAKRDGKMFKVHRSTRSGFRPRHSTISYGRAEINTMIVIGAGMGYLPLFTVNTVNA